ncbi:hypothetical protein [Streptomyces sp. ODS28]|uniref:hypothetical protein n=1 Tax=Streptomyces sp. ODS28 TaxID=3136688 RepID=UPI0031E89CED
MRLRTPRFVRGVGRNWPYLLFLVFIVIPLWWMAATLAIRSGVYGFSGRPDPAQVKTFLTFVGGGLATAATLFGALITREHNARERRRLGLDTLLKSLDSFSPGTPQRVAAVLSTMILLGHPRVVLRVLEPAWKAEEVDHATATWCIGQVLAGAETSSTGRRDARADPVINEATVLLRSHTHQLTDRATGGLFFPGDFLSGWRGDLPHTAKNDLLLAMGETLLSQDKRWWCPGGAPPHWPTRVWMKCAEQDPDPDIRLSAAVLVDALCSCFPQQMTAHPAFRDRVARLLRQAETVTGRPHGSIPGDCALLAHKITEEWGRHPAPVSIPSHRRWLPGRRRPGALRADCSS